MSASTSSGGPAFDYLVVLDFEATCDEQKPGKPRFHNEIIEFPSVVIDVRTRQVVDRIEQFVKPQYNPKLTPFCKKLTGITQEQVNGGVTFPEAFKRHQAFVGKYPNSCLVSCGSWDLKTMLPQDAWEHWVDIPGYYKRWINIKEPFSRIYNRANSGGMEAMLNHLRLPLLGRHHSGIDDCVNIAQIAARMLRDGWRPEVTSRQQQ
jgi:inhibitor of KinA sporulation pathway (predicted exonuclease)